VLLTVITAVTSMLWVGAGPVEIVTGWYEGFWSLLEFGMQMVLILATGYAIALSPAVARLIDRLALRINRPGTVYLCVLVVGALLNLVSWGWVVLAAVLARELALRVRGVHYPYLVACAYFSGQSWVAGLSSSIPLLLNTPGNFLIEAVRELAGAVDTAELNRHVARVAMATAYGESLTNLLQPFFLLTVLPVMGVGVRIQARDVVSATSLCPF
jgi:short-chain fatty acids transporter